MNNRRKTTLITGSTSGIGAATAQLFASRGHDLILFGRNKERMDAVLEMVSSYGTRIKCVEIDFAEDKAIESYFHSEGPNLGAIDNLINSAGYAKISTLEDISERDCDYLFRINITASVMMIKYALPNLLQSDYPSVVNVSSVAGRQKSISLGVHYTGSKAAIIGVTRHLGTELGSKGIRVNAIAPSQTHSPMLDYAMSPEGQARLASTNPLGRLASPEEQAEVIWFLCSRNASYINGAIIDVNGGVL